jgi:hypothetical protein
MAKCITPEEGCWLQYQLKLNGFTHYTVAKEANEQFFINNTSPGYTGKADLLFAGNLGETVTTYLEYYTLLFDPLKDALPLAGTDYENDPLGYLQANTSVVDYPGTNPVRVHNDIKDDLIDAYDAIMKQPGGAIPHNNGGLSIRFIENNTVSSLILSDHATGRAVDYEAQQNPQIFISEYAKTNEYFNSYLSDKLGTDQKDVSGWEANRQMAEAFRDYENHINSNLDLYKTALAEISNQERNSELLASENELSFFQQQIDFYTTLKKGLPDITKLKFDLEKIFTETMLGKGFKWGGDWWPQKDYMHFFKPRF